MVIKNYCYFTFTFRTRFRKIFFIRQKRQKKTIQIKPTKLASSANSVAVRQCLDFVLTNQNRLRFIYLFSVFSVQSSMKIVEGVIFPSKLK